MQALLRAGHGATFCGSYARLPYCRISQFLRLLRPPFSRLYEVSHFSWMRERGARWRILRVLSENFCRYLQKRTLSRPSGLLAVLFSDTGWGSGTPVGSIPSTGLRCAQRWRHRAALGGVARQSPNRPIARRVRRRRERPERLRVRRCRFGIGGRGGQVPTVCRAGPCRCTGRRKKAHPTTSRSCS